MIGRGAPRSRKAARRARIASKVAVERRDIGIGDLGELPHGLGLRGAGGVDQVVGAEGGDDPAGPAGRGDLVVMCQVRKGRVRGRKKLDPEPVEQRTGPVRVIGQPLGDLIMYKIGSLRPEGPVHADHAI
jgi:hypothetical protein